VKVDGSYEPVAQGAVSDDELLELLVTLGGLAYVDRLGPDPVSWRSTEDGLGVLAIKAAKREGNLHARFALQREAARPEAPARPPPAAPRAPAPPVKAPPSPVLRAADACLLDGLLGEARQRGASDLHIVAGRPVLFRIAGDLASSGSALEPRTVEEMLLPLVTGRLAAIFEKDGSCDFALERGHLGRFRVNVGRQRTGMKASLRLIGHDLPTLASLGLPDTIGHATHHHQGLIVVTGPTGHGKTSTLAALVNLLNSETTHHVITVEDPVEYVHPRKKALISQREVGTHTRSFASALKASLREDPDVIVVGELRDTETVRMALSASETGHLVLATMNTPSAAKTIERLIDLFPPGDQPQVRMALAGGLRLVVSQRLVQSTDGSRVFAAAEVLPGSVALWNLIRENKTFQIPSLQQRGKAMGIVRLDDSLAELVRAGKVTLDEARAFAEAPDELVQSFGGARPHAAPRKAG
jgi:twitching motility protein PilT